MLRLASERLSDTARGVNAPGPIDQRAKLNNIRERFPRGFGVASIGQRLAAGGAQVTVRLERVEYLG
jgi:hypothetical protein